jgi:hypothetical protein
MHPAAGGCSPLALQGPWVLHGCWCRDQRPALRVCCRDCQCVHQEHLQAVLHTLALVQAVLRYPVVLKQSWWDCRAVKLHE